MFQGKLDLDGFYGRYDATAGEVPCPTGLRRANTNNRAPVHWPVDLQCITDLSEYFFHRLPTVLRPGLCGRSESVEVINAHRRKSQPRGYVAAPCHYSLCNPLHD